MNVEIVRDDVPARGGIGAAQQAAEKPREILFRPSVADDTLDLASGHIERGDQGLSAVTFVFEFAPFDLARHHRQARRSALPRLNAGHLVDRDGAASIVRSGRRLVNLTDVSAFGVESRIRLRGQPVTDAMRLEVCFFFKKRPTERCEMFGTRPRFMASSAISRWLHWLM